VSERRITLKNPTGWFAAGREFARALTVLSDGAFKVYVHLCLRADRASGRLNIDHGGLATALGKSRRSIVKYVEELREHGVCATREAVNQHKDGEIEICEGFWSYVKTSRAEDVCDDAASYIETVRRFLAARKCVTVAPKNGAIMAGRKGPAMWLRYGRFDPLLGTVIELFS
jgi:hypothetical protein